MDLQIIPHTHLDAVWPAIAPMLARATHEQAAEGEFTIEQIRMAITQKDRHLIAAYDEGEIVGAATVNFVQYPQKRVAIISALGGRGVVSQEAFAAVQRWCKGMGASELRVYAKAAQARLFARVGMNKIYEVLGVPL